MPFIVYIFAQKRSIFYSEKQSMDLHGYLSKTKNTMHIHIYKYMSGCLLNVHTTLDFDNDKFAKFKFCLFLDSNGW